MLHTTQILSTAVIAACVMSLLDSTANLEASATAQPTQATIQRNAVPAMTVSDMAPIQSQQPQRWVF